MYDLYFEFSLVLFLEAVTVATPLNRSIIISPLCTTSKSKRPTLCASHCQTFAYVFTTRFYVWLVIECGVQNVAMNGRVVRVDCCVCKARESVCDDDVRPADPIACHLLGLVICQARRVGCTIVWGGTYQHVEGSRRSKKNSNSVMRT